MFGHIKAEEFTNLIEGIALRPGRQAHLETCARCRHESKAMAELRLQLTALEDGDGNRPEPDWTEFRAAVRDRLLSRSVQREAGTFGWTSSWLPIRGGSLSPSPAWVLALLAVAAFVAGSFWGGPFGQPQPPVTIAPPSSLQAAIIPNASETSLETENAVWSNASVFEEIASLDSEQSERFRQLLENEARRMTQDNPERK